MLIRHQGSPMTIIKRQFSTRYFITYLISISNLPGASKLIQRKPHFAKHPAELPLHLENKALTDQKTGHPSESPILKTMRIQEMCSLITNPNILFLCVIVFVCLTNWKITRSHEPNRDCCCCHKIAKPEGTFHWSAFVSASACFMEGGWKEMPCKITVCTEKVDADTGQCN